MSAALASMLAAATPALAANIVETAASARQFNTLIAAAKAAGLAKAIGLDKTCSQSSKAMVWLNPADQRRTGRGALLHEGERTLGFGDRLFAAPISVLWQS